MVGGFKNYKRDRRYSKKYGNQYFLKKYTGQNPFMTKRLAWKKKNSLGTQTMYFKTAGTVNNDGTRYEGIWTNARWTGNPGVQRPFFVGDLETNMLSWQEYKCLCIKVTFYSANISSDSAGAVTSKIFRGNCVTYKINALQEQMIFPSNLLDVITKGSCKMVNPRVEKFTVMLYRPKANYDWGNCDTLIVPPNARKPDPWAGAIIMLGNDYAIGQGTTPNQRVWYYVMTQKYIFRGRKLNTGGP